MVRNNVRDPLPPAGAPAAGGRSPRYHLGFDRGGQFQYEPDKGHWTGWNWSPAHQPGENPDNIDRVTDQITRPGEEGAFDWGSLFGGMGGFSAGNVQAGHATAGHATSFHGEASLIDTNDPIYSLFAPKPWMSGMLSKGKEFLSAATEDNIRLMHDNATRAGVSSSSPAYMHMVSEQRRGQQKALADALRDANLAWTLPAADRRAGALGQNANMLTNTSNQNASNDTQVSLGNAGFQTQTSIANAGFATQASGQNASNALQAAALGQQGWMFQTNFIREMANDQWEHAFSIATQGGQQQQQYQGPNFADYGNAAIGGANSFLSLMDRLKGLSNPNKNQAGSSYTGMGSQNYNGGWPAGGWAPPSLY